MELKEIQKKVVENAMSYGEQYHVVIDEEFSLLKLYEEMGELTQALLIHKKKSRPEKHLPEDESKKEVAKELADVFGMILVNAHVLGIDVEEALEGKWINVKR